MASVPYLKKYYLEKVVPELTKSRGYKNIHQVPNLRATREGLHRDQQP